MFPCTFAECCIILLQSLWKEVKRPLRRRTGEARRRQALVKQSCVARVGAKIRSPSRTARNDQLPERWCIDMCEHTCRARNSAVDACKVRDSIRHKNVADTLSRQGE